jgi:HEAT repeat protein
VEAALDAEHPVVRRAALDVLGHVAEHHGQSLPAAVAQRACALTEDEDAQVRAEACASLALLPASGPGDLVAREAALCRGLDDADAEVRQEAAAALGDLPAAGAELSGASLDALAARLSEPDGRVAFEAAFALASLGDARARGPLLSALRERRRRLDALEGLARLGDASVTPTLRGIAERWLMPWADRLSALASLVRLGDLDARSALAARVQARRFEERVHACALAGQLGLTEATPALRALAASARDPARASAMEALGAVGAAEDLATLSGWADDPALDRETRAVAGETRRRLAVRLGLER